MESDSDQNSVMESPRNTTLDSPFAGGPSLASSSRYLARLGQSRKVVSIACWSSLREAQGSGACCAVAAADRIKPARRTKIGFIIERTISPRTIVDKFEWKTASDLTFLVKNRVSPCWWDGRDARPATVCPQRAATVLEGDLGSKLQLPTGVGVTDLAEATVRINCIRQPEVRMIEHICGGKLKLQFPAFPEQSQTEVLEQSQVHRSPVRSVNGIPTHVAEGAGLGGSKSARVKPTAHRVHARRSYSDKVRIWNRLSG